MKLRHVVTCFLTNPADGTVLLGRRSERVSTYPGRWAAISGSVETTPLQQAYREIEEETGLERSRLRLSAEGRPVRLADWDLGVVWVVHPYLFRCDAPDQVRRDWEHVRFQWVGPGRIGALQTVPKLAEAYRSVSSVEGRPDSRSIFRTVREDRQHGAEELGLWTLEGLKRAVEEALDTRPAGELLPALREACCQALALRPSMAPARSAALRVWEVCHDLLAGGKERREDELVGRIEALTSEREQASLAPGRAALEYVPEGAHVVTLSYSFTVLSALREATDRVSLLTVAESRPACEGRRTASLGASFGLRTELMTDAAAARAVEEADLVLFGADSLCADGSVVNKVGTFALCCAARHFGTLSLCVATESKVLPSGEEPRMEEMDPAELGEAPTGVAVRNVYFERVPADLVGSIVTDSGTLGPEELGQIASRLRELEESLRA
ncbi:MAG: NUDIX domain-containing protein [Planctomycetota bacterium]|jgi:translation initiation factor 2B subunit (eIF-2B alpha/beta/delta family)/8-oxo-dGTP pyrophosphatase MutT (NUDIX family)